MLRSSPACTFNHRHYPTRVTTSNGSALACRCSRCAAATVGRGYFATPLQTPRDGPGRRARMCTGVGVPLSRLDLPSRRNAVARPARRCVPRSGRVHPRTGRGRQPRSRRPDRHRPAAVDRLAAPQADAAMAALADGSPWRDKLLPADAAASHVRPAAARDELEGSRRAVPRGLPHPHRRTRTPSTRSSTTTSTSSKRSARTPESRSRTSNIERLRDRPESTWTVGPPRDLRLPPVPERHGRDVPRPGAGDHDRSRSTSTTPRSRSTPWSRPRVAERRLGRPRRRRRAREPARTTAALEDNEMSEGVQRGLHAGANTFVEFGTHESAIGRFHATLDERLACVPMSRLRAPALRAARAGHRSSPSTGRSA